jgi:glutamate formiminotransferase
MCYICRVGLIEAVPNVSEGRRPEVIEALASALADSPGIDLLNAASDAAHNRTVFTLVGEGAALRTAILALYATAVERIDLRSHAGEHPRIGAVDVVPLVPLDPLDMPVCISVATELGAAIAEGFSIPVFLYEEAAQVPDRRRLETIRRGGFEGLRDKMRAEIWRPDFGPSTPHPSAGASAIGARRMLIAYNVNLETGDLDIARRIARAVRASNGGLAAVKAIGVRTAQPDVVQVSINLVDYERTSLHRVFESVQREADQLGVGIRGSEIVGLVPAAALLPAATRQLRLADFTMDQILECRLLR